MISIRPYQPADHDSLNEVSNAAMVLLRRLYRPGPKALASRTQLSSTLTRLVALADNRIVGTVEYHRDAASLHLMGLMVHPEHHRRGVATALIRHLAGIASGHGCASLRARTIKETGNAVIFERMGFTVIAERVDDLFISDLHPSLTEVDLELAL